MLVLVVAHASRPYCNTGIASLRYTFEVPATVGCRLPHAQRPCSTNAVSGIVQDAI